MRTGQICLLLASSILGTVEAQAEGCPTAKDDIATDRPDVTNSSLVVPTGSLQNENGVNFSMREDGRTFDGTNSRWRLGVAPCLELLVDLPTYFANVQGPGNSGFSDVSPALKWQISPIPLRRLSRRSSGVFLLKKANFLPMNQAHRSALLSHQRFDHPPPVGLSGRTRRSKSDLDDRTRNVCFNPMSGGLHQR